MSVNVRRHNPAPGAAAVLAAVMVVLAGCSSTFDVLPEKIGGLPANAPERPAEPMAFPNVYEARPAREVKPLDDKEQKALESELVTLREQQKQLANPPPPAKKAAAAPKKESASPKKEAAKTVTKTAPPPKKKQTDAVVPEQKGPVAAPKLIN